MPTIYFAGLVCFEGPDEDEGADPYAPKKYAAVIPDVGHFPFVFTPTLHRQLYLLAPLRSLNLHFTGADPGDADFQYCVPHLDTLTSPGVKMDTGAAVLRIPLISGALSVASYYPKQAHYILNQEEVVSTRCVGRVTRWDMSLPLFSFLANLLGVSDVPSDESWILIENVAIEEAMAHEHHQHRQERPRGKRAAAAVPARNTHFKLHRAVTTAASDDDIADVEEIDNQPCRKSSSGGSLVTVLKHLEEVHPTTATHSECSNSQWP